MEEYRQWVQNTESAKILSKNFRMWSFVQHSFMLQVLNFNAGLVQGYMLLGYKAISTGSEFQHVTGTCCFHVQGSCGTTGLDGTANALCQKL
jgi:hypothetical protein